MRKLERLARRIFLWAGKGNPRVMHLLMSRSNPSRRRMIRMLAKLAQRPDIAAELPGEELVPFFQEPPGSDALEEAGKEAQLRKTEAMLGLGTLILGRRRLEGDHGQQ